MGEVKEAPLDDTGVNEDAVRAALMARPDNYKEGEGFECSLWRAMDAACAWFSRSSRLPVDEVRGYVWEWAYRHPKQVVHRWEKAGEAGMVNRLSDSIFRSFRDYKHHKHELPFNHLMGEEALPAVSALFDKRERSQADKAREWAERQGREAC